MIDYMCRDVKYLKKIYDNLSSKLNKLGKYEEYSLLISKIFREENYKPNPENAWTKIDIPSNFSKLEIDAIKNLASIRMELAIQKNVPKKYIATDNDILILAKHKSPSFE